MLRLIFSLAIATWLGAVVSLTFIVTPIAHSTFTAAEARRLLRPLFPRYYRFGAVCGFIAIAMVLAGRNSLPQEEIVRLAVPVAVALVATLIGGEVLLPRLRDAQSGDERFERLHTASAMLNTTTLAALALAIAGAVMR